MDIKKTYIELKKVRLELPIYQSSRLSIKKNIINFASGGRIFKADDSYLSVKAIDEITLNLKNGDRLGIVGKNGSGKSTLLRLINGIYKPSSGSIKINGSIGSLIDISLGTDQDMTGRENIFTRGRLIGLGKEYIAKNLDEIINFTELGDFIDIPMSTYSSGMHLRLAFAISTIIKPDILLMDEWLSVGDESFKIKAEKRLKKVLDTAGILVIASHSYEVVTKNCTKVAWLENGKIKKMGLPIDICKEYFNV
jgi:lipopolysaccharide transport system ATP-binding protein